MSPKDPLPIFRPSLYLFPTRSSISKIGHWILGDNGNINTLRRSSHVRGRLAKWSRPSRKARIQPRISPLPGALMKNYKHGQNLQNSLILPLHEHIAELYHLRGLLRYFISGINLIFNDTARDTLRSSGFRRRGWQQHSQCDDKSATIFCLQ